MSHFLSNAFLAAYGTVLVLLAIYGMHRYHLVYLYYRNRNKPIKPAGRFDQLPRITVQLPMFNEQLVARRIIENACRLDYPRDRLQIQVLDDSTDETTHIARAACEEMQARGHNVVFIHRDNRTGYKAGALDAALSHAEGEFVCIFDADFVPEPDILLRSIHYFTDPKVGMVQARWDHINRDHSWLTRSQAILLDGHFMIEHTARNRSGRFMSFNGTAGLWRRACIQDAGGWQHDTLTEDLDLSYRAQLNGWQFVFLPDVISPAELPPEMNAFRAQQHRWTKGGAQTAIKLLPRILRSKLPLRVKTEAWFHLTSCVVYPLMVLMTLMLYPAFKIQFAWPNRFLAIAVNVSLFLVATCSASTFYLCSQREIFRHWRDKLKYLPFLMALGVGISLNNGKAVIEALFRRKSEFVRTPKFGAAGSTDESWKKIASKTRHKINWMPWVELTLGCYIAFCAYLSLSGQTTISLPFLVIFMFGYFYVGLTTLLSSWFARVMAREPAAEEAPVTQEAD